MKIYSLLTLFLALVMLFFPFFSLRNTSSSKADTPENETVIVENVKDGSETETELSEYIIGCVAAEMPALFEEEALKAQAVACYTYQKYLKENGNEKISDSSEIHQEYMTEDELKAFWGDKYDSYIEKIRRATESVRGEYLVYDGKTVPALYHAISPGATQSAEKVFGKDVKCLQSVASPGDRLSPDYISEKVFTKDELVTLAEKENIKLDENNEDLITVKTTDDEGFAEKVCFGNKEMSSADAREIFTLNSPYFTVKIDNGKYVFTVYGKGHGVGMSQYSADYMARQGSTYKEILLHFYKDAEIKK